MEINEILKAVSEGQLHDKSETELREMRTFLHRFLTDHFFRPLAQNAITQIDAEFGARKRDKQQLESVSEIRELKSESIAEMRELKAAVTRLETPHPVVVKTYYATIVILAGTAVIIIVAVLAWLFPREPQKSESPPAVPAVQPVPAPITTNRPV